MHSASLSGKRNSVKLRQTVGSNSR